MRVPETIINQHSPEPSIHEYKPLVRTSATFQQSQQPSNCRSKTLYLKILMAITHCSPCASSDILQLCRFPTLHPQERSNPALVERLPGRLLFSSEIFRDLALFQGPHSNGSSTSHGVKSFLLSHRHSPTFLSLFDMPKQPRSFLNGRLLIEETLELDS